MLERSYIETSRVLWLVSRRRPSPEHYIGREGFLATPYGNSLLLLLKLSLCDADDIDGHNDSNDDHNRRLNVDSTSDNDDLAMILYFCRIQRHLERFKEDAHAITQAFYHSSTNCLRSLA